MSQILEKFGKHENVETSSFFLVRCLFFFRFSFRFVFGPPGLEVGRPLHGFQAHLCAIGVHKAWTR